MRKRHWEVADEEDDQIITLVQDVDKLVFDQYHYADSNNKNDFDFSSLHLRDLVCVKLMQIFQKEY
jgi:hypothetical protein